MGITLIPLERAVGAIGIPSYGRTFWPLLTRALAKTFFGDFGPEINFLFGDGTLNYKTEFSYDFCDNSVGLFFLRMILSAT